MNHNIPALAELTGLTPITVTKVLTGQRVHQKSYIAVKDACEANGWSLPPEPSIYKPQGRPVADASTPTARIAEYTNLSLPTVRNALAGKPGSAMTKRLVSEACEALGVPLPPESEETTTGPRCSVLGPAVDELLIHELHQAGIALGEISRQVKLPPGKVQAVLDNIFIARYCKIYYPHIRDLRYRPVSEWDEWFARNPKNEPLYPWARVLPILEKYGWVTINPTEDFHGVELTPVGKQFRLWIWKRGGTR